MSDEAIAKGQHAERILTDPLVVEALTAIKNNVQSLFFELDGNAAKEREFLHLMDRARQQFELVFRLHISGLEVAKAELMQREHAQARLEAARNRRF